LAHGSFHQSLAGVIHRALAADLYRVAIRDDNAFKRLRCLSLQNKFL
jgi:hypothetical protein